MPIRLYDHGDSVIPAAPLRRLRRRLLLGSFILGVIYLIISIYRQPYAALEVTSKWHAGDILHPNLQRFGIRDGYGMGLGPKSKATRPTTPGFELAPHSCKVSDLLEDPLVKEYGQNNIRLSRTYEGSGARVRRLLQKALSGQPIHIAVIGGSVSSGHGVKPPYTHENYMYQRIYHWFQQTFKGAEHTLNTDSIIPATTAWYFSYCVSETLPDDADLVLVELDINHHNPFDESLIATEALLRTLLAMPSQPAVIYLSVFGLVFEDMTHGWRHSALISQWLDVPEINIRNWLLPHIFSKPEMIEHHFRNYADILDTRHINEHGHIAMGDMVIAFLREQLCMLQRGESADAPPTTPDWPGNDITLNLPRLGMLDAYDEKKNVPLLHPKCTSITSTKFPLKPIRADGWEEVNRNDKRSYESTAVGSEIDFEVTVDAGLLGIYFWMTKDESFGQVQCWVDNERSPDRLRYVSGYNPWHPASTFEHSLDMWNDLKPGRHVLTCKLVEGQKGGKIFRITATVTR